MYETVEAFYRPATVSEALKLLQKGKGTAKIVAGCTDAIIEPAPDIRVLIDITRAGLNYIRKRDGAWSIGATTTMSEIEESAQMCTLAGGLLALAAGSCGGVEIRNMATIGGNMANGSPAADLATPLLALDASAVVAVPRARRKIPLPEYLKSQPPNSILVELTFPDPPRGRHTGWSFQKLGRTAVDISLVNVAAGLGLDARHRVKWARVALGAVGPAPLRITSAEALLTGHTLDRVLLAEVAEAVSREVQPITDVRATAGYRREMAAVLTRKSLEECAEQAECAL